MKALIKKDETIFNPLTLELTIETKQEYDFLTKLIGNMSMQQAEEIANIKSPSSDFLTIIYRSLEIKNS